MHVFVKTSYFLCKLVHCRHVVQYVAVWYRANAHVPMSTIQLVQSLMYVYRLVGQSVHVAIKYMHVHVNGIQDKKFISLV